MQTQDGPGTIYLIEDDESVSMLVRTTLQQEGHRVRHSDSGAEALREIAATPPDLVILDLRLPDMDGREICRQLRGDERTADVPILMMTALSSEEDRVRGFETGADDYLPKPVSYRELALRVRALLSRANKGKGPAPLTEMQRGVLHLDTARRQAEVSAARVDFTSTEFDLLEYLVRNERRVVSRGELLEKVWGTSGSITTRRVDTYVQRLRSKLGTAGDYVHTHRGVGYRFEVPPT